MDYQELKNFAFKTVKDVKRTSGNLYNSAKITVQISRKEAEIDNRFAEIGRLIYDSHCGNDSDAHKVSILCGEIDDLLEHISDLKRKKELAKVSRKCTSCGCTLYSGCNTCPNCGCEL